MFFGVMFLLHRWGRDDYFYGMATFYYSVAAFWQAIADMKKIWMIIFVLIIRIITQELCLLINRFGRAGNHYLSHCPVINTSWERRQSQLSGIACR